MARHVATLAVLTIPSAGTDSNISVIGRAAETMVDLVIYAPAALTGTVTLYLGHSQSGLIANMLPLYIAGTAVTLAAGQATQIPVAAFRQIAVKSSGAEAADRVFNVVCQLDMI